MMLPPRVSSRLAALIVIPLSDEGQLCCVAECRRVKGYAARASEIYPVALFAKGRFRRSD